MKSVSLDPPVRTSVDLDSFIFDANGDVTLSDLIEQAERVTLNEESSQPQQQQQLSIWLETTRTTTPLVGAPGNLPEHPRLVSVNTDGMLRQVLRGELPGKLIVRRVSPACTVSPGGGGGGGLLGFEASDVLQVTVNGTLHTVHNPNPTALLVDFLRDTLGLTGTKVGCGEGGCGACSVVMVDPHTAGGGTPVAINSCLRLLCACDGLILTTVEGLGCQADGFSDVQRAIADGNGSQCGFCTPGWVTAMSALLAANAGKQKLTAKEIETSFDGNLCRCTGYRPILQSFKQAFAEDDIEECTARSCHDVRTGARCGRDCEAPAAAAAAAVVCPPPPAAGRSPPPPCGRALHFHDAQTQVDWWRVTNFEQLFAVTTAARCKGGRGAKLLSANTSMGVIKYYVEGEIGQPLPVPPAPATLVDITGIAQLHRAETAPDGALTVGGGVTLTEVLALLDHATSGDETSADSFSVVARHLRRVANTQVRNAASWAGNLVLAATAPAFPSDVLTVFTGVGVTVSTLRADGRQRHGVPVERWWAQRARELARRGGAAVEEILVSATIPRSCAETTVCYSDKTAQRHVNSHAIVNAAFRVDVDPATGAVRSARLCFGGVTEQLWVPSDVAQFLLGRRLDTATLQAFLPRLEAAAIAAGLNTGEANTQRYRLALMRSFVYKMFLKCAPENSLPAAIASACVPFAAFADREVSSGTQSIDVGNPAVAPVGKPIPKLTARLQASGEAEYCSDKGQGVHDLAGCVVFTGAEGQGQLLAGIDAEAALAMPGVRALVTAADVPNPDNNSYILDIGGAVPNVGYPVAVLVADTLAHARAAAKCVRLTYDSSAGGGRGAVAAPRAFSREEIVQGAERMAKNLGKRMKFRASDLRALTATASGGESKPLRHGGQDYVWAAQTVHGKATSLAAGDIHAATSLRSSAAARTLRGSFVTGGQKHFFLETQTCFAVPCEDGKMELFCGNQDPANTQITVAGVLNCPLNKVTITCRRVGGAYGGKINGQFPVAVMAAVCARKLGRGVMVHNERIDDMVLMGGRSPVTTTYDATFDDTGLVSTLHMWLHVDSGAGAGGMGDLAMGMQWADNTYYHENFRCLGGIHRTPRPVNTACRAPGVIQSIPSHEYVLHHVADELGMAPEDVRSRNFYQVGQTTPPGNVIGENGFNWTIPQLWQMAKTRSDFDARKAAVDTYNAGNRWRKRGISMVPVKYFMQETGYVLSSLISIFSGDGSVEVTHGGVELGQGINTKVAQAVALTLGCSLEDITMGDNSTRTTANSATTGGSGTSESSCRAAMDAATTLAGRLAPYRTSPDMAWSDLVAAAAKGAVSLTATGWSDVNTGESFDYATYGTCVSEVEVDALTGECQILRSDIYMDFGYPLNPAIDMGQAEGGFVMALGFFFSEEVLWTPQTNEQLNVGTWEYKPPSAADIPIKFNIEFLSDSPNPCPMNVLSSKASGEPPMALGCSAFFAAKGAIASARADGGLTGHFDLQAPLTVQQIQQACATKTSDLYL